jgi:hypothetical protein
MCDDGTATMRTRPIVALSSIRSRARKRCCITARATPLARRAAGGWVVGGRLSTWCHTGAPALGRKEVWLGSRQVPTPILSRALTASLPVAAPWSPPHLGYKPFHDDHF